MEEESYVVNYSWGPTFENDVIVGWSIKADALDTPWFAMAYFGLDDDNPMRQYKTNNDELLRIFMDEIEDTLYEKCIPEKNMYLQSLLEIENMTSADFM